ncbi:hypothetical protein FQN57_004923 [Myotisia sp. PD_48]|nr:hypothetical protein FQN57_004923 [Myotisia sp. PD_48]
MDPYDSDSSGIEDEELGDYNETGVLLGYAVEEPIDDSQSHLGGQPSWLDPSTPPPGNLAKCKICKDPMPLLLQLNADLPEIFLHDERWLYIFGCTKRTCNRKQGTVRALRAVKRHKIAHKANPTPTQENTSGNIPQEAAREPNRNIGADIFGIKPSPNLSSGNINPFSTSPSPLATPSNPFAPLPPTSTLAAVPPQKPDDEQTLSETFADKVRISPEDSQPFTPAPELPRPLEPWPDQSAFPTPYPCYFLDSDYEVLCEKPETTLPSGVQVEPLEIEPETGSSSKKGGDIEDKGLFESALDKSFLRFSTRLAHNPEQVLRYEFGGLPLLYSVTDEVGKLFVPEDQQAQGKLKKHKIPRCQSCGNARVFEVQLVPQAITILEEGREGIGLGPTDDPGMEWGTVILGVCEANCADQEGVVEWKEEWVGVQWEERM